MTATSAPLMKASASGMLFNRMGLSVVLVVPAEQRSGLGRVYTRSSSKRIPPTHTQASQPYKPTHIPLLQAQHICAAYLGQGGLPEADPDFPQGRKKAHLLWDAESLPPAHPAGEHLVSRMTKRQGKMDVPMAPALLLLTMPPCSGALLSERHVSCCGDPQPSWGGGKGAAGPGQSLQLLR